MKKALVCFGVGLAFLATPVLAQQEPQDGPPRVLQIWREDVKPGKAAAHEKTEGGWPRAFRNANWPVHYIAMTSISGPNEAWYLTGYDSLAMWEKDRQDSSQNAALQAELDRLSAQDGELLSNIRSITAIYREDLSYRAKGANIGQMRYFYVTTIRIRPGHEADYIEANRIVRTAHEKANVPEHWAVFQVTLGMPTGTYLIFQPLKSLTEADAFTQTHGSMFQAAIGEDGRKKLTELDSAATLSRETNIFAFSPKMSYVSKEMASADPAFWTPKPAPAAKPAAAKPAGQ